MAGLSVSKTLQAGSRVQCAFEGQVVPCEIVPTTLLDGVEKANAQLKRLLQSERTSHDATLEQYGQEARAHHACRGELGAVKADRDMLRNEVAGQLPTWARITVGVVLFGLGAAGGLWLGSRL